MSRTLHITLTANKSGMFELSREQLQTIQDADTDATVEIAKLRADNKALLEALKAFMGLPHLFDDMCVDERPDCKVCAAIKLARAAIEHSEPQ